VAAKESANTPDGASGRRASAAGEGAVSRQRARRRTGTHDSTRAAGGQEDSTVPRPLRRSDRAAATPANTTPRLPRGVLPRPRLDRAFDSVARSSVSLALVVAPAGAGKTTAVAEWAERRGVATSWYRPDADHSSRAHEGILSGLLAQARRAKSIVVIDDAHRLDASDTAELSRALGGDDRPPLLILSRREPAFVPVELALAGDLLELRYRDLRLNDQEADRLARIYHPEASDEEAGRDVERAQGWAAGIVLSPDRPLAAPRRVDDVASALVSRDDPLVDYVVTQVLAELAEPLRDVLTTICDEVAVDVEDAVALAGRSDAPSILDAAAAERFVVTPGSDPRSGTPTWAPHPLIAGVLRSLTAPGSAEHESRRAAHIRAAERYRRTQDAERAFHHARLSADPETQVAVLRDCGGQLIVGGHAGEVAALLAGLPPRETSWPAVQAVEALTMRWLHRYDTAKAAADRALASKPDRAEDEGPPPDEAHLAILAVWEARGGWRSVTRSIAQASAVLGCAHAGSADDTQTEVSHDTEGIPPVVSSWLMLELAALQAAHGDLASARIHRELAHAYVESSGPPLLLRTALALAATFEMSDGAYMIAGRTADACLAIEVPSMEKSAAVGRAHLARGWANLEAMRLRDAHADLVSAHAFADDVTAPFAPLYRDLLAANLLIAEGKVSEARRLLDRFAQTRGLPAYAMRDLALVRLTAAGFAGDLLGVDDQVEALGLAGCMSEASVAAAIAVGLTGAEARAIRDLEAMLTSRAQEPHHLDGVERSATDPSSPLRSATAAWAAVTRVALLQRMDTQTSIDRARALTADMLASVETECLLWTLAKAQMISPRFGELLTWEAAKPDGHPFAETAALALRSMRTPRVPSRSHGWRVDLSELSTPSAALDLTHREVEILGMLASGGTNAEIAAALFVTPNTVKSHLSSLYRKLGVDSRRAAIAAARSFGLLP
jgi:LuxR family transcriptional regulator, maltose regulon positive regulatory protein